LIRNLTNVKETNYFKIGSIWQCQEKYSYANPEGEVSALFFYKELQTFWEDMNPIAHV